jgi:LysW-gamma-L-lysine carboxypeptidase
MSVIDNTIADTLLTELVRKYSPSRSEHPAAQYLVEEMGSLGFKAFIDGAGNAVGEMGEGENTLVLLGHIDTVPGNIPVRIEGDQLYGRGTVDAKGPLATFVCATANNGIIPGWRVVVIGAVEEEAATSKGARYALNTYHPDAVVIGEPSCWDHITVGYKGRLLVDYELTRKIGHTAGPELSVCEVAHTFWHKIREYTDEYNSPKKRIFDQLTPSLRTMNSDDDGFVQKATLTIGFRLPQFTDTEMLQRTLHNMAGDALLQFRGLESAFRAKKNTTLTRAFIKAVTKEGGRLQYKLKSGTSDMNVVGPVWQCPIVAYGPGDSAFDHTPNEHINLREYHKAISVLSHVIHAFCT